MPNSEEDYELRCLSLGPLSVKGMGLHNCGYFAQVISRKGCRNSGMRLTLAKGDVIFITNNQIPKKPGWLFGIKLTADSSLAEVGLVHRGDIVELSVDDISRWPEIVDRPIPSSVSSVMFLGGKAGKIHFGIPARVAFRRTGAVRVGCGALGWTRENGIDRMGHYLEVDVGELVLLVGYASENYYAIKASYDSRERVWSGLLDHEDVVPLRPAALEGEDVEVMDVFPSPRKQSHHVDVGSENGLGRDGLLAEASTASLGLRTANELPAEPVLTICDEDVRPNLKRKKTSITPSESRILRWRSQVHEKSRSLLH
ncbi:hypothetical protein VNI00_003882 [Paramarasmius palmivorus]|uniref:Uncharacterized protein n=1 Tax=Paramarasmius palmivorus TaxID=297713 RepID=A0AAW0DMN1_9AGAR